VRVVIALCRHSYREISFNVIGLLFEVRKILTQCVHFFGLSQCKTHENKHRFMFESRNSFNATNVSDIDISGQRIANSLFKAIFLRKSKLRSKASKTVKPCFVLYEKEVDENMCTNIFQFSCPSVT
jgi:hypothetical protein